MDFIGHEPNIKRRFKNALKGGDVKFAMATGNFPDYLKEKVSKNVGTMVSVKRTAVKTMPEELEFR